MQICLLHYAAPPVVGGVESVLAAQANLLAERGHTVRVLAARGRSWRNDIPVQIVALADSTHPLVLHVKQALDQGIVSADFGALQAQLEVELRAALAGCDLLIAHNVASLNKNLALTAALHRVTKEAGAPALILWHHDLAWTTPRYHAELPPGEPWSLLRNDWPWAVQVVVSAERRRELAELLGVPAERIAVVPNGVDSAAFLKLDAATVALAERHALLESGPLLLLPVRITPRKNIELALHTLAHLRQKMADARLLVTGPMGPHNPANVAYLERLRLLRGELGLEHDAIFLADESAGFVPDAVVADLYRLADLLFFPSREEGFGIPMLEAALSRLPVFCSDIPPLRELGNDDVNYFSPDADPAAVAELIYATLQGSPEARFAARARTFTWQRIYTGLLAPLMQRALRARAAAPLHQTLTGVRDAN